MNTIDDSTTIDQGKDSVNGATKAIQGGLQDAKSLGEHAGNQLASRAKTLSTNVGASIDKVTGKAQAVARQGRDMTDAAISASARYRRRHVRRPNEVHQGYVFSPIVGDVCKPS